MLDAPLTDAPEFCPCAMESDFPNISTHAPPLNPSDFMKLHLTLPLSASILALALLSSCAIPRVVQDPSDVRYLGLADQIGDRRVEAQDTLHVIITHGMGHDPDDTSTFTDFEEKTLAMIEDAMGVERQPMPATEEMDLRSSPEAIGKLRETRLGKADPEGLNEYIRQGEFAPKLLYATRGYRWKGAPQYRNIRYHWISYSWYLAWLKTRLQTEDEPFLENSSYLLNRLLKRSVMNKGFPDAVNYLSDEHRRVVRTHFIDCFNRIADPKFMGRDDEVVLVSSSLGSKVLLDSLLKAKEVRENRPIQIAERTSHFFMFANQIPLLDQGENVVDEGFRFLIETRGQSSLAKREGQPELAIIAFGDPSDLLTYYLNADRYRKEFPEFDLQVGNVEVRNPGVAIWPLFREPKSAHSGHRGNRSVMKRIVFGSDLKVTKPSR